MKRNQIRKRCVTLCLIMVMVCAMVTPAIVTSAATKDVTTTFTDKKKVKKLIGQINDWCYYQYKLNLSSKATKTVKLSARTMFNIACMNQYDTDTIFDERPMLTSAGIWKRTNNLFGKKPKLSVIKAYTGTSTKVYEKILDSGNFVGRTKKGVYFPVVGDWGNLVPRMKISKITKIKKGKYKLKVVTYSEEMEENIIEKVGTSTITIKKSSKSKYGYIITGIQLKKN